MGAAASSSSSSRGALGGAVKTSSSSSSGGKGGKGRYDEEADEDDQGGGNSSFVSMSMSRKSFTSFFSSRKSLSKVADGDSISASTRKMARNASELDKPSTSTPAPAKTKSAIVVIDVKHNKSGYASVTAGRAQRLRDEGWSVTELKMSVGGRDAEGDAYRLEALANELNARVVVYSAPVAPTQPVYDSFTELRRDGILVANVPRPGYMIRQTRHLPRHDAPPKQDPVRRLGLAPFLSSDDDGYVQLPVLITSGPTHDGEREMLHSRIFPALQRRLRHRRVRLLPVDLRTHWPRARSSSAAQVTEACKKSGCVHIHLWSDHAEDGASARENQEDMRRWAKDSRHDLARDDKVDWLRVVPPDRHSQTEIELIQMLGLHKSPLHFMPEVGDGDDDDDDDENEAGGGAENSTRKISLNSQKSLKGSSTSSLLQPRNQKKTVEPGELDLKAEHATAAAKAAARGNNAKVRVEKLEAPFHTFVYARDRTFESSVVGTPASRHFYASSQGDVGRVAELFSAVYAHPTTHVRTYRCTYVGELRPTPAQKAYASSVRRNEGLGDNHPDVTASGPRLGVRGAPMGEFGCAPCASPRGYCGSLERDFAQKVMQDIWDLVDAEIDPSITLHRAVALETPAMFGLRHTITPMMFRRRGEERAIKRCVKLGRPPVLIFTGKPGSGCSTIMMACSRDLLHEYSDVEDIVIISLFVGVASVKGGTSRSVESVMRSLVFAIAENCPDLANISLPGHAQDLVFTLHAMLRAVVSRRNRRIAILIDGYDEIDNPACLSWLPPEDEMPFGVQFILSVAELPKHGGGGGGSSSASEHTAQAISKAASIKSAANPTAENAMEVSKRTFNLIKGGGQKGDDSASADLQGGYANSALTRLVHERQRRIQLMASQMGSPSAFACAVPLEPLPYHERKAFSQRVLKLSSTTLPELHQTALTSKFDMGRGMFCSLISEEMAHMWHVKMAPSDVERIPVTISEALESVLDDAEHLFGRETVSTMLSCLAIVRGGLAISDLKNLCRLAHAPVAPKHFDAIVLPRLLRRLHFVIRGPISGVIQMTHATAHDVVYKRYSLAHPIALQRIVGILIQHFVGENDSTLKTCHSRAQHFLTRNDGRRPERIAFAGMGHVLDPPEHAPLPMDMSETDLEDHRLIVAVREGPRLLLLMRRFEKLCALFTDLSFVAGKVLLGFGAELIRDMDAMLGTLDASTTTGRALAPGAVVGDRARLYPLPDSSSPGASTEESDLVREFHQWASGARQTMVEKMRDMRTFLRVHLNTIARQPDQVLQLAYNYADDSLPRRLAMQHFAGAMAIAAGARRSQAEGGGGGGGGGSTFAGPVPVADPPIDMHTGACSRCSLLVANRLRARVTCQCVLRGHLEQVLACVATPTGFCITASDDGTARVWDLASGVEVLLLRGHRRAIRGIAFHRSLDTSSGVDVAATASDDGAIKIWDLSSGGQVLATMEGHTDRVTCCAISADGSMLVSGSSDCTMRMWDLETHTCVETIKGHGGGVTSVSFSPLGMQILSSSWDGTAALWHCVRNEASRMLGQMRGHSTCVACSCYSPFADTVATASHDGSAALWEPSTDRIPVVKGICLGHNGPVTSCAFSCNSSDLFTASQDGSVRVWDIATCTTVRVLPCHDAPINSISLTPCDAEIVTASDDRTIRMWSQIGPCVTREPCDALDRASPEDGEMRALKIVRTSWRPDRAAAAAAAAAEASGGGGEARSAPSDGRAKRAGNLGMLAPLPWEVDVQQVNGICYVPSSSSWVTALVDTTLRVYNESCTREVQQLHGHSAAVTSCASCRGSSDVLATCEDNNAVIWSVSDAEEQALLNGHTSAIYSCALTGDGNLAATGDKKGVVKLWNTSVAEGGLCPEITSLQAHEERVTHIAMSDLPANATADAILATCASDGVVKIWSIAESQITELAGQSDGIDADAARHPQHTSRCTSCMLHVAADVSTLVTSSFDGSVGFWDFRRERMMHAMHMSRGLRCGAVSPSRPWLAFGCGNIVSLYDIRNLSTSFAEFECDRTVVQMCFHTTSATAHALTVADAAGCLSNLHLCGTPKLD
ncbi:hypothetical protein RI054_03g15620 [Pseudoscourfieldia marina]